MYFKVRLLPFTATFLAAFASVLCVAENVSIAEYCQLVQRARLWRHLDFDVSMQTAKYPEAVAIVKRALGIEGRELLAFCRELYEQNSPAVLLPQATCKIPKIIHQIWLGSSLPPEFDELVQTVKSMHAGRGWSYKLWTDEDLKDLVLYNQRYFDEAKNAGARADLLRYELLYRYGGVYVDIDYECLQPFDELHYLYDLYTGLEPLDSKMAKDGVSLVAARPGHPVIAHYLRTVKDDWNKAGVVQRTGPWHWTKSFIAAAGRGGNRDIAFPATYFYPMGAHEKDARDEEGMHKKREEWIKQGAYAIHHFANSWFFSPGRRERFKNIKNDEQVKNCNTFDV